ncbi:MAG TPA: acetate uptake transporter [Micromonosporaceae bacterium]|nr:acetate uptake transporter [Micromonosporaceae bacterium]
MAEPEARAAAPAGGVADPAPLGLAAFALTTFLLSASNAGWTKGTGAAWLGYALAYGGLVQLLAGMWEFRRNNTFGAVAFASYGGFWIGLFLYQVFVKSDNPTNDLGWILLAFAIFNTYMLISAARINMAVFAVFLTLELTEIVLFIGFFSDSSGIIKTGGVIGIITAIVAWYTSFAGVLNSLGGSRTVPVGTPLMR